MHETFLRILSRADANSSGINVYPYYEVAASEPGVLNRFVQLYILREIAPATGIRCDECEENCWIEPVFHTLPNGRVAYYSCNRNEQIGGFFVELDRFRQWELNFAGLANLVTKMIKATGGIEEDAAGRIWFLGTVVQDQEARDIFLARGLTWPDAADVVGQATRLQAAKGPIILVPAKLPSMEIFGEMPPTVRSLAELATVTARTFKVDIKRLLCRDADLSVPQGNLETEALTEMEIDILESLATNHGKTMIQVQISEAAGYSRSAIQGSLQRLQKLGLIAKPAGTKRKGFALTEKGFGAVNHSG